MILALFFALTASVAAQETGVETGSEDSGNIHAGRHLVELGYTSFDGFDADLNVVAASYTYSYSRRLRFTGTTQFVELEAPQAGRAGSADIAEGVDETGLGDSLITVQYDPGANLTSSPWIPDTLGVFGALLLPTGDSGDELSGEAWAGTIGLGWPLYTNNDFLILPSAQYTKSFKHGEDALHTEELSVGLSLLWVFARGAWIGFEPSIGRDFESDKTSDAFVLIFGKSFRNGLGVDLRWGTRRRYSGFAERDDEILLLGVSWQFGAPPRH